MNGLELAKDEEKGIKEAEALAVKYESVKIVNNDDYAQAGEILKNIAVKIKTLETMRMDKTRPLDKLKKDWIGFFSKPLDKLKMADTMIRRAMRNFYDTQEAAKRKEEARLKALAEKEAKKLEARAEKAGAKGKDDKAEHLREQAQQAAAMTPIVESKVDKVEGISMKTIWKFEILDESKLDRKWLMPDEKKIGQAVRALKGDFKENGITVYSEIVPNVRA